MVDLITETEEAMRRERLENLWHEHKTAIFAVILGVIIGTGVFSAYQSWQTSQKVKGSNEMYALLENETFPDNISAETKIDAPADLQAVTLMNAAGAHIEKEEPALALPLYTRVADDVGVSSGLRDYATLMQVRLMENQENPDRPKLIEKLTPMAKNNDSPYQAQAALELAVLHAGNNNYAEAQNYLTQIKEMPLLPETLYMKAQALSHVYESRSPTPETVKENG